MIVVDLFFVFGDVGWRSLSTYAGVFLLLPRVVVVCGIPKYDLVAREKFIVDESLQLLVWRDALMVHESSMAYGISVYVWCVGVWLHSIPYQQHSDGVVSFCSKQRT
jgi:hypothetical protein